jgi:hypothetical protein
MIVRDSKDVHHIFPQDWCERKTIPRARYNAIVNKTPISYKANRMIDGVAPRSTWTSSNRTNRCSCLTMPWTLC